MARALSLEEIFNKYPKEKVELVISKLTSKDRKLLELRFDREGYVKDDFKSLDIKTKKKIEYVLAKIINYLENEGMTINPYLGAIPRSLYVRFSKYPREKVDTLIEALSKEDRDLLKLRFADDGEILESYYFLDIKTKELINRVLLNLDRRLKNNWEPDKKRKYIKEEDIFERFREYPKEDVILELNSLSLENKAYLGLRYDKDGKIREDYSLLDKVTKDKVASILRSVNRSLSKKFGKEIKKKKRSKSLYELYCEYSKEDVDLVVSNLNEKNKKLLFTKYDESLKIRTDYDNKNDKKREFAIHYVVHTVIKNCLQEGIIKSKYNQNILEKFGAYDRSDVIYVLNNLSREDREILSIRYDVNGDARVAFYSLDSKIRNKLIAIFEKIERHLKMKDKAFIKKNFLDRYQEYSIEEVLFVMNNISVSDKEYLKLRYLDNGEEREDYSSLDNKIKTKINYIRKKIDFYLKKNRNLRLIDFIKTNSILNSINDYLNDDYIYIVLLKYGRLDKNYFNEEISIMTNYSLEDIDKLLEIFIRVWKNPKVGYDLGKKLVLKK